MIMRLNESILTEHDTNTNWSELKSSKIQSDSKVPKQ